MAIYHLSTKPISRSKGRIATASIAYRAGIAITDERTGKEHDYTNRGGVVETTLHTPNNLNIDRVALWNLAETTETRKNSRTAREIVVNLPYVLHEQDRSDLVNRFAKDLVEKYGIAVDVAIHTPDEEGDDRNHHAHIMLTTRKLERLESGKIALTSKSQLEMSNTQLKERGLPTAQEELKIIRKQWADITNERLDELNIPVHIDHRSHKDRGLDTLPTKKLGWEATALERRGVPTQEGDHNRMVKEYNDSIKDILRLDRQIKKLKEHEQAKALVKPTLKPTKKQSEVTAVTEPKPIQEPKTPPITQGQTVKDALIEYEKYNQLVASTGERMRTHEIKQADVKMAEFTKQHRTLQDNAPLMFKGKHKEKMQMVAKRHAKAKTEKKHYQNKDYTMDAKGYIESKAPEVHAKHEQASNTLHAQASFKYGTLEAKAGRSYTGEITAVTRLGIKQKLLTGKKIYHDLDKIDPLPNIGDNLTIKYDHDHKAHITAANSLSNEQQHHQPQKEQQHAKNNDMER